MSKKLPPSYPEELIQAAVRLRQDERWTFEKIAAVLGVKASKIATHIRDRIGETRSAGLPPLWSQEEHDLLVELAPVGLGLVAIAERIGRPIGQVERHAEKHRIKIAKRTMRENGSFNVPIPPRPTESEAVFAGISFRAPTDRPVRGVARPTRGPGRVPMRPATRVAGVSPLGAIAGGGE